MWTSVGAQHSEENLHFPHTIEPKFRTMAPGHSTGPQAIAFILARVCSAVTERGLAFPQRSITLA
jgi:hypothetical protein